MTRFLNWCDALDIAIALEERYGDTWSDERIRYILFEDLCGMVCDLDNFVGDRLACREAYLEKIQLLWLEEREF